MVSFLGAHRYDPGRTQRPLLAGAVAGFLSTAPAIILLMRFGSLQTEGRILDLPVAATLLAGWVVTAIAGALYSMIFGRAANDVRSGWMFGMAFGFVVWTAGAVLLLPLVSGGRAPAGNAALGLFLSLVVWGGTLGVLLPYVHRLLRKSVGSEARKPSSGPGAKLPHARAAKQKDRNDAKR